MKVAVIMGGKQTTCLIESTLATMSAGELRDQSQSNPSTSPCIILGYDVAELSGLAPLFRQLESMRTPLMVHTGVRVYFYEHPTDGPEVFVEFRTENPGKNLRDHLSRGMSIDVLREVVQSRSLGLVKTAAIANLEAGHIAALKAGFAQSLVMIIRIIENGAPLTGPAVFEFVVDKIYDGEPPHPLIDE